jgi:hypothetical protein
MPRAKTHINMKPFYIIIHAFYKTHVFNAMLVKPPGVGVLISNSSVPCCRAELSLSLSD